jgi:RsiW-degrading membrane proteinase PrsW (M82 family)
MRFVGRHTGERAAEVKSENTGFPRRKVLLLALGVTGTLVAWGVLVYAAIDFGQEARSGEPTAWVLLTLTTLGAAACLFVTLILGARVLPLFQAGGRSSAPTPPTPTPPAPATGPTRPTRPPGHRASR